VYAVKSSETLISSNFKITATSSWESVIIFEFSVQNKHTLINRMHIIATS